jgi:hypothetical protein
MTVRVDGERLILSGSCSVEDAEPLLQALQVGGVREIDWSAAEKLHTAVIQLMLAAGVPVTGTPADPRLGRHLRPLFRMSVGTAGEPLEHHDHAGPAAGSHRSSP